MKTNITQTSLELFLAYAKDACNWSGQPLIGGNVGGTKEERGNITQLKVAGLIKTHQEDRQTSFIEFTSMGIALAASHGIEI